MALSIAYVGLYVTGASWSTAQQPGVDTHAPTGYTGAVASTSGTSVTLVPSDGKPVTVAMTPGWTVVIPHTQDIGSLKTGDFIASPNTNVDAGSGQSTEVRVMEPGYKPEEGTHPMGKPNTSMTHGTIQSITHTDQGVTLEVVYTGGSRHLAVARDTKVIGYEVHPNTFAKKGMAVTAVVRKDADGVSRAARLILNE